MEQQDIPRTLYKYRSFQENIIENKRFQKKSFTNGEIYFANHYELNDPFDLKIRKKFELLPDEDKLLDITYQLAKGNGNLSFNSLWEEAKLIHIKNLNEDPNIYKKRSVESVVKWLDAVERGIFCLCEKNDDILMWSHYGNSNMGFCIGYNTKKLMQHLFIQKLELLIDRPLKVKYYSEYPDLKTYVGKNTENIVEKFRAKSIMWSYEKEWRLIIYNRTSIAIQIPYEIVEEIILGSNTLSKSEEEILTIQRDKYPHAKVFKVEPDDSEFKLNVLPYNP